MLDLSHLAVRHYGEVMVKRFRALFGDSRPDLAETISQAARVTMTRIAGSNALYNDLDHTIAVTEAGQDILRGKLVRDGNVKAEDWTHFLVALLCYSIGFCRDLLPGDDGRRCVIDASGKTVLLPVGVTNGALWPYFIERSTLFVQHYFADHPLLEADRLAEYLQAGRFPIKPNYNTDPGSLPGLLRAADIIGTIGDPDYTRKLGPMLIELREAGLTGLFGYEDVAGFHTLYHHQFETELRPLIGKAIRLLELTASGRAWLAGMHAHLLLEQHPLLRDLPE